MCVCCTLLHYCRVEVLKESCCCCCLCLALGEISAITANSRQTDAVESKWGMLIPSALALFLSPFADGQLLIAMPVTQSALVLDCCRCALYFFSSPRSPLPTVCHLLFQFSSCVIGHVGGCYCCCCCCSVVLLFCFICHYRVTLTVCVFESKE